MFFSGKSQCLDALLACGCKGYSWPMQAFSSTPIQTKVRRLTLVCLLLWIAVTWVPIMAARHTHWNLWGWPLDFWMAAQGCVLFYLLIVTTYAWLVNRWEREAGTLSFEVPTDQDV